MKKKLMNSLLVVVLALVCSYVPSMGLYFLSADTEQTKIWNALNDELKNSPNRPVKTYEEVNECLNVNGVDVGAPLKAFETDDPLEPMNRFFFDVNQYLAIAIVRKVGYVYELVVPDFAIKGLSNLYEHLRMPIRFFNNLLQGKILNAFREVGRFFVNAALGLGGLFDTSSLLEFYPPPEEGFGQTLGYWGVNPGVYLVMPMIGPTNTRDFVGYLGDMVMDPLFWIKQVIPGVRMFLQLNHYIADDKGKRYLRLSEIVPDPYQEQKSLHDIIATSLSCE